jgi:hypothetical protein
MSKVKYTSKEVLSINHACDVLDVMMRDPSFNNLVKRVYGNEKYAASIGLILGDIGKMRDKMNDGLIEKRIRGSEDGKNVYFTRRMESTSMSKRLRNLVKNVEGINLRYENENETCPTDVRIMIYAYINTRGLRREKGVKVDDNMRSLAPNTFSKISYILRSDRKSIPNAVKEILQ